MDLRASLFRGRTALTCSTCGSSNDTDSSSRGRQKDFLTVLVDLEALPVLHNYPAGQSYLSECFSSSYPTREIDDDLIQEPCHRKCDDVLSILSSLKTFEQWDDEYGERTMTDSMLAELRSAKIQALRANIARIKAECAVLFERPSYASGNSVNRTTFHALTVVSLRLSATILLNRITKPDVRTDPEAQAAARELVLIAQRLRRAKCLERPRRLIWPLPLFVAGIEVVDKIYQEWLLSYITELEHWDGSMRKVRNLLERIIGRQEEKGRRIHVKEMLDDFDANIIV
ncbi:hypothetical protein NKR23_g9071 [Pleurostoma richardsiae]|uniref:Uncharacterized protein n=1 Tax=Pleurostoma richardsiae TaxID=41990 RepID=A0AA38VNJ8_9PEZI|nr:hypothetical protein NKR23_g9071 [Pleurostoma richardsiae]